jgi:hypothetical protein
LQDAWFVVAVDGARACTVINVAIDADFGSGDSSSINSA